MSVTESKTLITVAADTKQARDELNKLADTTKKQTEELKRQADNTKLLGNKWDELSKSMVGLQLHDAFKRVAAGASEATGGVLDLNMAFAGWKVAGPWGAAVGAVGGALVKAASSLSAFSDEVEYVVANEDKLRKKQIDSARAWAESLIPVTAEVFKHHDAQVALYGRLLMLPSAMGEVTQAFANQRDVIKKAREQIDAYNAAKFKASPQGNAVGGFFGGVTGADRSKPDRAGKPLTREQMLRRNFAGISYEEGGGGSGGFNYDVLGERASENSNATYIGQSLSQVSGDLSALSEIGGSGEATVLERMFGKKTEIDGYAESFSMLTGVATSAYGALVDGNMSAGEAVKKFLKDALKGLGSRMLVRAIEETAEGFAALSNPFTAPTAGAHFKAAGLFAAGAVAAGAAASQISTSGGGSSGGGARAPNVSGSGGGSREAPTGPIVVYSDAFAEDSARGKQLQAERMIQRAGIGNSAVQRS